MYDVWIFCEMRERSLWATNDDDDDASRYVREARDEQKKRKKKKRFFHDGKNTQTRADERLFFSRLLKNNVCDFLRRVEMRDERDVVSSFFIRAFCCYV
jgi:hypothetical protein